MVLALLMAASFAEPTERKAICTVDKTETTLTAVEWPKDDKGSSGILAKRGLQGTLTNGLVAQLRYEHAYGATFVHLRLLDDEMEQALATAWLPYGFDMDNTGGAIVDESRKPESPQSLTLHTRIDDKLVRCWAFYL